MNHVVAVLLFGTPVIADAPLRLTEPTALEVLEAAKAIRPEGTRILDASVLSVAERENPTRHQCCDWGVRCLPHDPGS